MNARNTTTDQHVELSTTAFQTAAEYFDPETDDPDEIDGDGPAFAKGIVWYDQTTPIFVCEAHHEHVAPLEWEGDEQAHDYEQVRTEAYTRLVKSAPECDACTGDLAEKVEL